MCEDRRRDAASPDARNGEEQADEEAGTNSALALIKVREGEKESGSSHGESGAGGGSLDGGKDEAAVEELFAKGGGGRECKEGERLEEVLRQDFRGHQSKKALPLGRKARYVAKTEELGQREENGQSGGYFPDAILLGKRETQISGCQAAGVRSPYHDGDSKPLKSNCGCVEGQAISGSEVRPGKQLAHADGPAPGHQRGQD